VLKMNVPRVSIIGDRGAGVAVLVWLSTCCVEEFSFDLGDEMISVGHTANIWGSLEQGSLRLWVLLDGDASSIRNSNLFHKLTGSTLGLLSDDGPVESKSQLVEESTKPELLDMGNPKVPQLDMPLRPNLLVGSEALVGRMHHRSHGLESWPGFALAKQSDLGKEAGIKPHGQQVGSILVPLSSVMEDSELVLELSNGFTRHVLGEKRLGTDE
jgi:hypothetical protein